MMLALLLANASRADLDILFVILAVIAFGVGIWLCSVGNWIGGLVAALIGVIILVFAA